MTEYSALEDKFGTASFQKFPVTIVRGSNATVWDETGTQYVDCMGGYGVAIVGHCNEKVVSAIRSQATRLITCHGSYYNDIRAEFLERLARVSPKGLNRSYLTNSGAESVETAIKLARRYTGRSRIISTVGGFHGKTFGALSATWNKKYRKAFEPLLQNFDFVPFGDSGALIEKMSNETAAVILEPIQGESGVIVPPADYLPQVREECNRKGVLLILDEIQTGLGRTGKMWAAQHWDVVPDIMTIAKGLAGGVPIGAAVTSDEIMNALKRGEHTSTFGGNPLACAAGSAALEFIEQTDLPGICARKGETLKSGLSEIANSYKSVRDVRGMGLMLALGYRFDVHQILLEAIKRHLLLAYSGRDVIRFLPPAVITEEDIRTVIQVLGELVGEDERRRVSLQN